MFIIKSLYKLLYKLENKKLFEINMYIDEKDGDDNNNGFKYFEPIKNIEEFKRFTNKFFESIEILNYLGCPIGNYRFNFYCYDHNVIKERIN